MAKKYTAEKLKEGLILTFDKPYGWTSFYLVNKVRYILCKHAGIKKLKVGHAGTLDPLATGVLVLCTGKATKKITEIQDKFKEYIAEITLGKTTPSFDLETEIDHEYGICHITEDLIAENLKKFKGKNKQIPPLFSAKNINGIRAYKLARGGIQQELEANEIEIYELEIQEYVMPLLKLRIKCSKGTYIRSLARDIGIALGSGAHLSALRRTAVGQFNIDSAIQIENFKRELNFL
ncbi:MAG: tRNA pseudouridine(55) synthase TruB [Bacteroidales bacterium]|nr:tRNA pseudouridine(55) synthase TruB [Bacteroidales bacterium]